MSDATQHETTAGGSKTRRAPVEDSSRSTGLTVRTVAKDSIHYWKPKLRRQRYGNRTAGTYRELPALYVRIHHLGREHAFTFQTLDKNVAATQARDTYKDILSKGWEAVLKEKRPQPAPEESRTTVGRLLAAVAEKRLLEPLTLRNYANCLRTVVSELFDIQGSKAKFDHVKGGNNTWRQKIDAVDLAQITADRVERWKTQRLAKAGQSDQAQRSAKRTINSYIRCSRSLFSDRLRNSLKTLHWPTPLPFAGIEFEKAGSMAYHSEIEPAKLVQAARRELQAQKPELYKILLLGFMAGLRRGEIDGLEWPAFDWNQGVLRIIPTEVMRLKTESSEGEVPLDPEVMAEFRDFHRKRNSTFVIESARKAKRLPDQRVYRCHALFKEVNAWLRQHGVTTNKPLHTLRKELGAMVTTQHGIYAAKDMLRHSDISTTARHYADQKNRVSVGLGAMLKGKGKRPPQMRPAAEHGGSP